MSFIPRPASTNFAWQLAGPFSSNESPLLERYNLYDMTGGAQTITMPGAAASGVGRMLAVSMVSYEGVNLTVQRSGTDTIRGTTAVLPFTSATLLGAVFVSDGVSNWVPISFIRSGPQAEVFATTGTQMNNLIGETPNGMWTLDSALPINDLVGSVDFASGGAAATFQNATDMTAILGLSNNTVSNVAGAGGIISGGVTDWDRAAAAGSIMFLFHFKYVYTSAVDKLLFGSFSDATTSRMLVFQSQTNGFLGWNWYDSVSGNNQTVFISGLVDGETYSVICGYDAGTGDVLGFSTNANTTGAYSVADATIRAAALTTGQPAMFMGKGAGATLNYYTSQSILNFVARFQGVGINGWQAARATILADFTDSLPLAA